MNNKNRIELFTIGAIALIFCVTGGFSNAETYQYDQAGRLTNVTYDDGSSIDYTYDPAGNILKIARKAPSVGVLGLPDINAVDGTSDISVLLYDKASGSSQVHSKDGTSDAAISNTDFGTDPSIAMIQLPDVSGNGVGEIAILGTRPTGQVRVQVKDALTGANVNNLFFGNQYAGFDLIMIPDFSGNGMPEIAVLGENDLGAVRVQIQDVQTGAVINNVFFGTPYRPRALVTVPDVNTNGFPEVVFLGVRSNKLVRAQVRDANDDAVIKQVFFGDVYEPLDIVPVPDVDMSGSYELAELAVRPDTGAIRIQIKDSLNGNVVKNLFLGTSGRAVGLAVLPDTNTNGAVDIAFLLERDDGVARVQVLDALDGNLIKNIFYAVGRPYSLAITGDLNTNTFSEIAVVGIDNGQYKVQIRDGSTGENINTIDFP